ncbi:ZBED1, partial [Symbiodinium microadriaticum]
MRHEDELSQKRTETDFILTLEVAPANATPDQEGLLEQLYKMTVEWRTKQEQGKVNNSLRLTLFIGLLMYYELKVHEATASAESLEHLAQLGFLRQLDGNPVWNYLRWNYDKEELETSEQPPLPDAELRSLLTVLKTSIGAPGVLLRFHSSRKLVEQHKSAVTFFLGIGMRDPQALICYRALQQLCFNSSTQLIKMRLKPVKMERQPLVKILQEKFPAPPARSEEQRVTFLARTQQQWRKGKGRGRSGQQEGRGMDPSMYFGMLTP